MAKPKGVFNPYLREATVTIAELVPVKDELPYCEAWLGPSSRTLNKDSLEQCGYRARFLQNGKPVCGIHAGSPGTLWHPKPRVLPPGPAVHRTRAS
jgi:hypothetical protein